MVAKASASLSVRSRAEVLVVWMLEGRPGIRGKRRVPKGRERPKPETLM
jgi:hypothetical protein